MELNPSGHRFVVYILLILLLCVSCGLIAGIASSNNIKLLALVGLLVGVVLSPFVLVFSRRRDVLQGMFIAYFNAVPLMLLGLRYEYKLVPVALVLTLVVGVITFFIATVFQVKSPIGRAQKECFLTYVFIFVDFVVFLALAFFVQSVIPSVFVVLFLTACIGIGVLKFKDRVLPNVSNGCFVMDLLCLIVVISILSYPSLVFVVAKSDSALSNLLISRDFLVGRRVGAYFASRNNAHVFSESLSVADPMVRIRSVQSLGRMLPNSDVEAMLLSAAKDPDWGVRYWSITFLGDAGSPASLPTLEEIARSKALYGYSSKTAENAIKRITNRNAGVRH